MLTFTLLGLLASCFAASAEAQVDEDVLVFGFTGYADAQGVILRFDRKLQLLDVLSIGTGGFNETDQVVATDGQRRRWIPLQYGPPAGLPPIVLRLDGSGLLLDPIELTYEANTVAAAPDARMYVFGGTRSALDLDGNLLWQNGSPLTLASFCPQWLAVTGIGSVWVGGCSSSFVEQPKLVQLDPGDGSVMAELFPPFPSQAAGLVRAVSGGTSGSLWISNGGDLTEIDGLNVVQSFPISTGSPGTWQGKPQVLDGAGRVLVLRFTHCTWIGGDYKVCEGDALRRYDAVQPDAPVDFALGGFARSFSLGTTGEELFAVVRPDLLAPAYRLVRLNLATGVRSSAPLAWGWSSNASPLGDSSGFVFANVVERAGDADGDGAANGAETAAGSSPFDSTSRPDGPKVYLSFTPENAIELTVSDPDSLRHPTKGLDVASFSVSVGGVGEVLPVLLPFLTSVTVDADWTTAQAVFGNLPLASDLKLRIEVAAKDLTGAVASDWQVTPPGDL